MNDNSKPTLIRPPSQLNEKVTVGGPGAVDEAALERAEKVITDLSDNYLEWVKEDLAKLVTAFDKLKSDDGDIKKNLEDVFQVAHDIKGQGGSFDYALMTVIGNQLCRFIETMEGDPMPLDIEVIELHVQALQIVIARNLSGDGGLPGARLLDGLEKVIAKRRKK